MDIKDFILIAGGILIAMVVGHGFWIALRAKREPLRLDIVPDLIPDDIDEMERLRGELPNGGARVRNARVRSETPAQTSLDLEAPAPVLMDPLSEAANNEGLEGQEAIEPTIAPQAKPRAPAAPKQRARVREVEVGPGSEGTISASPEADPDETESVMRTAPVEELLVIHVLAPKGEQFSGEGLVSALRAQGLRYGDMNIFHRVEPTTKAHLYSVANVVEPGTFDLADLDNMRSPGMSFFLQLPGPDDAGAAFADMLSASREVALALGGEQRDEQMSLLTGQATEHMRQRIADFTRRRLFKRA